MKKTIPAMLLLCLLFCGCGKVPEETNPSSAPVTQPDITAPAGFYNPGDPLENATGGAVRAYPLPISRCLGFSVMGDGILVFSDGDAGTRLTLLTGETLTPTAEKDLDIWLNDQIASIPADAHGLSYFDDGTRETVLLDETLREITRIAAPEGLVGYPILSADWQTMYYTTGNAVCAMDLETRLPRVLRQYTGGTLSLDGVHLDDGVLKCSRYEDGWQTFFFSAQNGQLLDQRNGLYEFVSFGQTYITSFHQDGFSPLLFGTAGEAPGMLHLPAADSDALQLLEVSFGVLSFIADDSIRMDYYDLTSGRLASSFTLEDCCSIPTVLDGGSGILWLLDGNTLYRWDTAAMPSGESRIYTDLWYPRSNPDLEGIARCQALAQEIGQRHGVEILVWEDVYTLQPWDYRMTEEHLVPLLEASLTELDQQLRYFPAGFFETLSEDFSGLTVCLVRQMRGNTDNGSVEQASGLQYWIEDHACIALSTVNASKGSFYHELCHVLDTRIMAHSNAYDQWEALNPNGFAYDYDYAANATRNAGEYLRDAERCFIDTYSMSFPKEDRARILEYAMTEGNDHYFQSKTMQNKLRQICIGIREAFGLKKSPDTFLWEQYLQEPLAYTK